MLSEAFLGALAPVSQEILRFVSVWCPTFWNALPHWSARIADAENTRKALSGETMLKRVGP